jgi:NAD(P)-dependent dehydrogenase (short-subunit alcohol dehydrogenase family)
VRGLRGKTAIVSGGATKIGQAVAETLVGYGVHAVIADINDADGAAAVERLGSGASFIHADITRDADIKALVEKRSHPRGGSTFSSTSPAPISTTPPRPRARTG